MIDGYQIRKPLFSSSNATYLDSVELQSGERRLIQYIDGDPVTLSELAELKNDFEISSRKDIDGILHSLDLVKYLSGIALVKEYYEGVPLNEYMKRRVGSLGNRLRIALQLSEIVQSLHDNSIVHRDIRPDVFIIDPENEKVRLVNVRKASSLAVERVHTDHTGTISGLLQYISPEQTGRMNRSVDYRTDIYSLGVLFYQLFSHRLPFESRNPLQIIYSHIAKNPDPPSEKNPEVPAVLSGIIMKMLSKNAEDRYQSAGGIAVDLKECLKQYQQNGQVEPFPIGRKDRSTTFNLSEKLYGRDQERRKLIDAFQKSRSDTVDMIMVTGYSGIGKTRLINEIYKPLAAENGNFISGKFDQYSQNSPYTAFIQAIQVRIRQILAEDTEGYRWWSERILDALGENGKILLDVIPEMEVIIGQQPEVVKLGLAESQDRFLEVFEACLGALASREKPLVIFIDDLQWADAGSLDIIYNLLTHRAVRHVLLIGAYRDNEVGLSHPLTLALNRLKERNAQLEFIELKELKGEDVNQLIADSLRLETAETRQLSELIMGKTGGNPFFIKQFLEDLVRDQKVYYDPRDECWRWKLDEIREMRVTDNVVDLLVSRLGSLSPDTRHVMRTASAIGNRFDLKTLSTLSEMDSKVVSDALWEAVSSDFIQPADQRSRHLTDGIWEEMGIEGEEESRISFQFQHDRIQQAAYSLIPEGERAKTHLKIGRQLLAAGNLDEGSDEVFDIANHFNIGMSLIEDPEELVQVARLNLQAGNIAKNSNSYTSSLQYLRSAMRAITPETAPDLYREILIARSECEYLCGNYEQSEQMYEIALENAESKLEKAQIYADRMKLYENTSRNPEAIRSAIQGLKLLSLNLPEKPGTPVILFTLLKAKFYLRGKSISDLKDQDNMESPELVLGMKILMNLWGPAYLSNPNLLVLAILRMVILSVRHGNAPESALAYAFYGFINCAQLKAFDSGYEYGKLGLALNEKFDDKSLRSKVYVIFAGCTAHWKDPLDDTLELLRKAHEVGQEANDLVYSGYALNFIGKNVFFKGDPLDTVIERLRSYVDFGRKIQSKVTLHHLLTIARVAHRLAKVPPDPDCFRESVNAADHQEQIQSMAEEDGVELPLVSNDIYSGFGDYVFGEYESCLTRVERASDRLVALLGLIDQAIHAFLHSAALLAMAHKDPATWKSRALKKSAANQKLFKKWAENAPENWEALYLLVEAERAVVKGDDLKAGELYKQSRESADKAEMLHYVAIINEREAGWYTERGYQDVAGLLRRTAYINYSQWGAAAKVEQMMENFPDLERTGLVQSRNDLGVRGYESMTSSSLDLQSIFKASTTISGEVVFEDLLEKLLVIVMENAGAQRGTIVMVKQKELRMVASASLDRPGVQAYDYIPLSEAGDLPHSVLRFGFHSGQPVIVENPVADNRFSTDPYIREHEPRSVLCQPIIRSGDMIALLYLENRTTEGAFTPARLEVLNLLSGQIAVSLQNAELYKAQRQLNEAYQRFVPVDFIRTIGRESILDVRLGDSISDDMTVMFCDIRSYTSLSEGMTPKESFNLINDYLKTVGPVIIENNGFINHYLGDGFVALFKRSPEDAIRATIQMFRNMEEYNRGREERGESAVRFGIGLHKGPVMLGIIGDQERHDANVLSDAVNISSRLESMTRDFGANILTSRSTIETIEDKSFFTYRNLGRFKLKGKEDALELIEIIDADGEESRKKKAATLKTYSRGLEQFKKGALEEARASFEEVLRENPTDPITRRYLVRIDGLDPAHLPEDWDGTESIGERGGIN